MKFSKVMSWALVLGTAAALALPADAQQRTIKGKRFNPGIAVDPDGCTHWLIDDGWEGGAVNRVTRDGMPVCLDVNTCMVANSDQLFATDSASISASGRAQLKAFFQQSAAFAYAINGHTDSRASDEYNIRLSQRRANAVAKVAKEAGANVVAVRGFGERLPVATNNTAAGRQKNRRVEIECFHGPKG